MDLSELKNLDFQTLKTKVLQIADKKTLIKFGISFGAVVFFLIIYYAILNPIVNAKKLRLAEMNNKQEEATKFISEIKGMQSKIKLLTPQYEKYSTLFHSSAEVEGLYQTLSEYAGINNLVITKIEKQTPKEVSKSEALEASSKKKKKKKKKKKAKIDPEISQRAAVLANMKKQIATAKVNAQRAATIEAQKQIETTK